MPHGSVASRCWGFRVLMVTVVSREREGEEGEGRLDGRGLVGSNRDYRWGSGRNPTGPGGPAKRPGAQRKGSRALTPGPAPSPSCMGSAACPVQ